MTGKILLEQIVDKRGTLTRVLSEPCQLGRPARNCPLSEWRRRMCVQLMTDNLVCILLQKHLECEL